MRPSQRERAIASAERQLEETGEVWVPGWIARALLKRAAELRVVRAHGPIWRVSVEPPEPSSRTPT